MLLHDDECRSAFRMERSYQVLLFTEMQSITFICFRSGIVNSIWGALLHNSVHVICEVETTLKTIETGKVNVPLLIYCAAFHSSFKNLAKLWLSAIENSNRVFKRFSSTRSAGYQKECQVVSLVCWCLDKTISEEGSSCLWRTTMETPKERVSIMSGSALFRVDPSEPSSSLFIFIFSFVHSHSFSLLFRHQFGFRVSSLDC